MAGLPTVQVLLDAATNDRSFPYDITGFVSLDAGIGISTRGRSDELSAAQPVTCALTLDNTDGRFSLGAATYGALDVNRLIRVKVNGVNRFTGFVQSWPVAWPNGGPGLATAAITATDGRVWWAKRELRSFPEETILRYGPAAYWVLNEPEGSLLAADSSGNSGPSLRVSPEYAEGKTADLGDGAGDLPVVRFGAGTGVPTDSHPAVMLRMDADCYTNALALDEPQSLPFGWATCTVAVAAHSAGSWSWILDGSTSAGDMLWVFVDATGELKLHAIGVTTTILNGGPIADGLTHTIGISRNFTTSAVTLWVDGVAKATGGPLYGDELTALRVGWGDGFAVTLSHLAVGATELASPSGVFLDIRFSQWLGAAADRGGQAIWQTANAFDTHVPNAALEMFHGSTPVPHVDTNGKTLTSYIDDVAEAEGGVVVINGSGEWQLKTRDIPASKTTPDLTIPVDSEMLARDTVIEVDLQRLITRATGTRPGGTTQQIVVDRAAETPYGVSASTQDYLVTTDAEVQTRLDWLVNTRKTVGPRLPALKLDLLSASPADQAAVLALDVDSRIDITGMPAQAPGGTTLKQWVLGYAETINSSEWSWTANTLDWTQYASAFILDDDTFGLMDNDACRLGL